MKNDHIINLLEENRLDRLSAAEVSTIESHTHNCAACLKAYEAARLATELLKARMSEVFEPSPFFKTRVMAALNENRGATEQPAFARLWKSAWALVSSMVVVVAILSTLSVVNVEPADQVDTPVQYSILNELSDDGVFFDDDGQPTDEDMTSGQVLETILVAEDADGSN